MKVLTHVLERKVTWHDGELWSTLLVPAIGNTSVSIIHEKRKWFTIQNGGLPKPVRAKSRNLDGAKREAIQLLKIFLCQVLSILEDA